MPHDTPTPSGDSRRQFCATACRLASFATLGPLLGACGGGSSSPTTPSTGTPLSTVAGSVSGRTVTVTIDGASPLGAVGGLAQVRTAAGVFLVSRTAEDTFTALTATCTHEACEITGFNGARFVCPCHGSQFSAGGAVLNGPATRALPTFATAFSGGVLTIAI
ncbi:MAG: ubiquinol-cytochrome c reductase iron-sulfur subunit [Vicinamibacterales bacterium]